MQLINVRELVLEEFIPGNEPPYAILSHRWLNEEVSQKDFVQSRTSPAIQGRSGYKKIEGLCGQAIEDGYEYAWIDTCCIDKTSSAELSEAINSMFKWYRQAGICYAYLNDVPAVSPSSPSSSLSSAASTASDQIWQQSEWFHRGWTLQELIAPEQVVFFDASWTRIGTKTSLGSRIEAITGIDKSVLDGRRDVLTFSVARRMSWAAGRKTTRPEDAAYSLIGLFDVNMPMIYGEGHKAFIRLQEEILKSSDDHSIFAWKDPSARDFDERGMLATSPNHFKDSGAYTPTAARDPDNLLVTLNNTGLSMQLEILIHEDILCGILNCQDSRIGHSVYGQNQRPAVYLVCLDISAARFQRVNANSLHLTRDFAMRQRIYIKSSATPWSGFQPQRVQREIFNVSLSINADSFAKSPIPLLKGWQTSPQSVHTDEVSGRSAAVSAGICWSRSFLLKAKQLDAEDTSLSKYFFQLPPFLDCPAVIVEFENVPALVIGRGPEAGIIVGEAPSSLMRAVESSRPSRSGLWASDSNELMTTYTQRTDMSDDSGVYINVSLHSQQYWNQTVHRIKIHFDRTSKSIEASAKRARLQPSQQLTPDPW